MNTTCPACGHQNAFDSVFCSRCATKLSRPGAAVDVDAVRGYVAMRKSNAVAILVLGILSLTVCAALGPIAWVMGNKELARIVSGEASPEGFGMTKAGRVCGIVGTVLLGLTVLWVVFEIGTTGF